VERGEAAGGDSPGVDVTFDLREALGSSGTAQVAVLERLPGEGEDLPPVRSQPLLGARAAR
jgi:hypothetical protein